MSEPTHNPEREALLRALQQANVSYVVIGGAALEAHDQPHRTDDIDIVPELESHNIDRLADALNRLGCRLITDPDDEYAWVPLPDNYFTAATLLRAALSVPNRRERHEHDDRPRPRRRRSSPKRGRLREGGPGLHAVREPSVPVDGR